MSMRALLGLAALCALPALALAGPVPRRPARPATLTTPNVPAPAPLPDSAAVVALLAGVHNGACPLAGVATGGQPDSAHIAAIARAGFRTVLDLRAVDEDRGFEEARVLREAGLRYVNIPITPATLTDSTFDAFRAEMRGTGARGVFVHCASGNRVGAAMVPWLVLDRGWDLERAVTAARAGGLKSAEMEARARDYVARRSAGH